jgi:hypothetical protein
MCEGGKGQDFFLWFYDSFCNDRYGDMCRGSYLKN